MQPPNNMDNIDISSSSTPPLSPTLRSPHSPIRNTLSSSSTNDTIRVIFILSNSDVRPQLELDSGMKVEDIKQRSEIYTGWKLRNGEEDTAMTKGSKVTLISHGRLLGDKEQLKDIFVNRLVPLETCYIHVVHRRPHTSKSTTSIGTQLPISSVPVTTTTTATTTTTTSPTPNLASTLMLNPAYLAISDSISLFRYLSRNDICKVLSMPTLGWDEMEPKPRVKFEVAMKAIQDFFKVNSLEIPSDDKDRLEVIGKMLEDELVTKEERGEEAFVEVDLDGSPYKLVIPEPRNLTSEQRNALARFQSQAELIKTLQNLQNSAPMYIPMPIFTSTPTRTAQPPPPPPPAPAPAVPPPPRRIFAMTFTLNLSSVIRLVPAFVMSGIKSAVVLWMLTRDLKWTDRTFIGMASFAIAWWIWECVSTLKRDREREIGQRGLNEQVLRRRAAELAMRQPRPEQLQPVEAQERPAPPVVRGPLAGGGMDNLGLPRRRPTRRQREPIGAAFALFGLDNDRRSLRLFYVDSRMASTIQSVTDHRIPSSDVNLPIPPRDPGYLWNWLIMPLYLFIVSATPAADAARKMAIRQREVHMRLLVQKLTKSVEDAENEEREMMGVGSGGGGGSQQAEVEGGELDVSVQITESSTPHPPVLPQGLSKSAERYYRRVLKKGETVDWEEEREAQAALLREAGGDDGGPPGEDIAFF